MDFFSTQKQYKALSIEIKAGKTHNWIVQVMLSIQMRKRKKTIIEAKTIFWGGGCNKVSFP